MKPKQRNPYERLREQVREWVSRVLYPRQRVLWHYAITEKPTQGWRLDDLRERVAAADALGWNVVLKYTAKGLEAVYVERPGSPPWEVAP